MFDGSNMTVNQTEGSEGQEGELGVPEMELQDSTMHTIVQDQQVVMMNGEQHVVITSEGGLVNGHQVVTVQGDDTTFLLHSSPVNKIEPEDLSFSVGRGDDDLRHSIDLEAGAQAIQASAAHAVQNVLRSLKESDKSILNQILPQHIILDNSASTAHNSRNLVISDMMMDDHSRTDDMDDMPETLTYSNSGGRRNRSNAAADAGRVQIPKQFSPFGFHCTLEAATAQWVRKDEDRCTYMNKGQFYGVTLEYRPNPAESLAGNMDEVKSVVMLVFRDAKNPEDEINAWAFWHQRQPTNKQRILDAETNNISDDCGISRIEDISYNAICVYWHPTQKPAFISLAVQCLSTDFSLQKGVKGLPLHLQIDTYVKNPRDGEYDIAQRSYCQVKVFCDKGAERKFRQEERRASRKVAAGGQRVLDMYHQCQERSEFYSMVDLSKVPVLYSPENTEGSPEHATAFSAQPFAAGQSVLKQNDGGGGVPDLKRRKMFPPPETRMVVYVRQENEEIYTPLHLVPPSVPGLARAIESKYNVSATAIRYLYRRNTKGIIAKLDDDLLKFYCNEDTFLMQVTAIELEGLEGQDSTMYDITLCEVGE